MKILFVNTLYAPFKIGGAEVSVQTMAEGMAAMGHQVYVITLGHHIAVQKVNGVIIISLKTKNLYHIEDAAQQPGFKKMIWHLLDSWNPLYKTVIGHLLDRIKPDVVNTNNIQGFSPYLWKIIKSRNIKLVHTMRDYYLMCHNTTMYTKCGDCQQLCTACKITFQIKKKYLGLPDGFVGISNFILDQHNRFNIAKAVPTKVISNGMNTNNKVNPRIKHPVSNVVLGFIGKVNEQKGVDFMFSELAKISSETPFELLVAGKAEKSFQTMLTKKYTGKFNFTFIGNTDAQEFYQRVDLVIVPSAWNEPFGRIPIEAVAGWTPVCLAYKAGLKELYNEQEMWRFDMRENSLYEVIDGVLKDPKLVNIKSQACAMVPNKYAPTLLNQQLTDFIHTLHD
jgi:glycosyltransferase involved in cell wall biosynthesis